MRRLLQTLLLASVLMFFMNFSASADLPKLKKSITWEKLKTHPAPLPVLGHITPVPSEIGRDSWWSVGCETLDRDFTNFDNYKRYVGLTGVGYEPVGYLGEKDGVYCVLCRATVVYPGAKPFYALVYVSDEGLQNIWEIWMGVHAEKK